MEDFEQPRKRCGTCHAYESLAAFLAADCDRAGVAAAIRPPPGMDPEAAGHCRRRAPQLQFVEQGSAIVGHGVLAPVATWPPTTADDWCCDWIKKG